jgi:hypothetical protein
LNGQLLNVSEEKFQKYQEGEEQEAQVKKAIHYNFEISKKWAARRRRAGSGQDHAL